MTFSISILLINSIKLPNIISNTKTGALIENFWEELKLGFNYLRYQPMLVFTLLLILITNFNYSKL